LPFSFLPMFLMPELLFHVNVSVYLFSTFCYSSSSISSLHLFRTQFMIIKSVLWEESFQIHCDVYGGTRDGMTGSSSDDWILLALRFQALLITLNHNTNVILLMLQTILTLIFSVLICIHNSLLSLRASLRYLTHCTTARVSLPTRVLSTTALLHWPTLSTGRCYTASSRTQQETHW
jgi:hypothetical protein